jgi:hypothetical protein
MTPNEVLKKVISLGIDAFSITDHNSGFNCAAFDSACEGRGVLFIPGIELQSAEEIHLLGYFPDVKTLKDFDAAIVEPGLMQGMKNDPQRFGNQIKLNRSGGVLGEDDSMLSMPLNLSVEKLVEEVHNFNGIAVAAHIDRGFSVLSQLGFIPQQLKLDAVEIRNLSKIQDVQSKHLKASNISIISSSDTHHLDLMSKPSMKLWLDSAEINSCLKCIKGEGPGRITLKEPKGRAHISKDSQVGDNKSSEKDWKTLYQ